MTDLFLDTLERDWRVIAKYPWWSVDPETPRPDPRQMITLIQRLREAEDALQRNRTYIDQHHDLLQQLSKAQAQVARVRNAATEAVVAIESDDSTSKYRIARAGKKLRAALAALE